VDIASRAVGKWYSIGKRQGVLRRGNGLRWGVYGALSRLITCCYEGPIARVRPIRERKKVYERRKRLYIFRMVACLSRISIAELII